MWAAAVVLVALWGLRSYSASFDPPFRSSRDLFFVGQDLPGEVGSRRPVSGSLALQLGQMLPPQVQQVDAVQVRLSVSGARGPSRQQALFVSASFFSVVGLPVSVGRPFGADDAHSGAPPCLLAAGLAEDRAGTAEAAIGSWLAVGAHRCQIVGVFGPELDYWAPGVSVVAMIERDREFPGDEVRQPDVFDTDVLLRLPPGMRPAQVEARLRDSVTAFAGGQPHLISVPEYLVPQDIRSAARLSGVAAAISVAVACALLLGFVVCSTEFRTVRLWTHAVIGATPGVYAVTWLRQVWFPALVGSLVCGWAFSEWTRRVWPEWHVGVAPALLVAGMGAILALGVAIGTDALMLRRLTAVKRPHSAQGGQAVLGHVMWLVEAAVPALTVVALTHFLSLERLLAPGLGMDVQGVSTLALRVVPGTPAALTFSSLEREIDLVQHLPGVEAASVFGQNPVVDAGQTSSLTIDGVGRFLNGNPSQVTPGRKLAGPGFAVALGSQVVTGRDFTWNDRDPGHRVAIVNQAFVRQYLARGETLGVRLKFSQAASKEEWATIVGVVWDMRHEGFGGAVKPEIYLPLTGQEGDVQYLQVIIRGRPWLDPMAGVSRLTPSIFEIGEAQTLSDAATRPVRSAIHATVLLAVVAFVSALGYLVGAIAYVGARIAMRRRDVAVELALGANSAAVTRKVLARVAIPPAVATGLGIVIGLAAISVLRRLDFDLLSPSSVAITVALIPTACAAAAATVASVVSVGRIENNLARFMSSDTRQP
jgi:putative ABC transport system permease protein